MDDVTGNLFSLFCSTWRAVVKMFVSLFRIEPVKASKKFSRGSLQKKENGETESKRVLDNLRMPKLQDIFTTIAIACHDRYKRLTAFEIAFAIILL